MATGAKVHPVRSSSPYQVLLYFNGWYAGFFLISEALIFIYKGQILPFPSGALVSEIVLLFAIAALEYLRLFYGKKGNLTEHVMAVGISIALSLASTFGCIYLLIWQTYVLRAEFILNVIQLLFIALEFIFAIISLITFSRAA